MSERCQNCDQWEAGWASLQEEMEHLRREVQILPTLRENLTLTLIDRDRWAAACHRAAEALKQCRADYERAERQAEALNRNLEALLEQGGKP